MASPEDCRSAGVQVLSKCVPCAYCGGDKIGVLPNCKYWQIQCYGCGLMSPFEGDVLAAIEVWNGVQMAVEAWGNPDD